MYNSINHFIEFGVKNIEKKVKNFVCNGGDLADLVLNLKEDVFELVRNILQEVIEDMDNLLRNNQERKKYWEIIRKDENKILTIFGEVRYRRTYFKLKNGNKREYLVDKIIGIEPHDRVSADVVINVIEEAVESSYRKAGEMATYLDEISKQAVMKKIHSLEIIEPGIKVEKKKKLKTLYVEADEDYVSLQTKCVSKEKKGTKKKVTPKLVYVHEGIDTEKSSKNRNVLKNVRYFGEICENTDDLWIKVADYIDEQYDVECLETIYLSGDGASWIKNGLNWLPKSKFVLDNFHLKKYIKQATAHLDDRTIRQELEEAINHADKNKVKETFEKIIELTSNDSKLETIKGAKRYILNNWDGIKIKKDKGAEIVGCSAEGHISHVYSDRLSTRPGGWSKIGVEKMSKLLIYTKNGGRVYDLVMAQKRRKAAVKKREEQEILIKELRRLSSGYENVWNSKLTVLAKGHKTGLYNELKWLRGLCG